jgi:hypothetical protein
MLKMRLKPELIANKRNFSAQLAGRRDAAFLLPL